MYIGVMRVYYSTMRALITSGHSEDAQRKQTSWLTPPPFFYAMSSQTADQAAAADSSTHVRVVSLHDIDERVGAAYKTRDHFNAFGTAVKSTLGKTRKDFFYHLLQPVTFVTPPSMYRMYGEEAVKHWLRGDKNEKGWLGNGALHKLVDMLYEDHRRFGVGDMGSVWFDTDLVGAGKSKKTRVALYYETSEDRFTIMLDATFDHTW